MKTDDRFRILEKYDKACKVIGLKLLIIASEHRIEINHDYIATQEEVESFKEYYAWYFDTKEQFKFQSYHDGQQYISILRPM